MRASIVIPCRNQAARTLACLQRIAGTTEAGTYEIVLVDNGSTDATSQLAELGDDSFTVVRNEADAGEVAAANQGAAMAKAPVIVLLEQDALPSPGWLHALLDTLDSEPGTGAACARVVWSDGAADRVVAPAVPASGLAVRCNLWHAVGGLPDAPTLREAAGAMLQAIGDAGHPVRTVRSSVVVRQRPASPEPAQEAVAAESVDGAAPPGAAPAAAPEAALSPARADDGLLDGVLVLGMHRSGTSALSRVLNLLGLAMCRADDIMPAHHSNQRGFWESSSLRQLNDALLGRLGGAWDRVPTGDPAALATGEVARLARDAFESVYGTRHTSAFVWKDPRNCLLAPFWDRVLDLRTAAVVIWRHPVEVADSLVRRDGTDPEAALDLWEAYTRAALAAAATRPHLVVAHHDLLSDPERTARRLLRFLADTGVRRGTPDVAAAVASIDRELWHERKDTTPVASSSLSPSQTELLDRLQALTGDAGHPPALTIDAAHPPALTGDAGHPPEGALPQRGVVWVHGGRAGDSDRIAASVRAVRRQAPELGTTVVGGDAADAHALGAWHIPVPAGGDAAAAALRAGCFDETLVLPGDSFVAGDVRPAFDLLHRADVAVVRSPHPVGGAAPAPASPWPVDPDVLLFRRSPAVLALLDRWAVPDGMRTGPALEDAVRADPALRCAELPPELGCWFEGTGTLCGPPVVLRGDADAGRCATAAAVLAACATRHAPVVHVAGTVITERNGGVELVATVDRPLAADTPATESPAVAPTTVATHQERAPAAATPARSHLRAVPSAGSATTPVVPGGGGGTGPGADVLVHVVGPDERCNAALVAALAALGLPSLCGDEPLGLRPLPPSEQSPLAALRSVNDHLLGYLGGTWAKPPALAAGWHRSPSLQPLHEQLRRVMAVMSPTAGAASWSELRMALTLPLWRDALADRPQAAVLVYRDPGATVESLHRTADVHPAQALALWDRYTRAAAAGVAGLPVVVIRHELAMADPEGVSRHLRTLLGAGAPPDSEAIDTVAHCLAAVGGAPSAGSRALPGQAALLHALDGAVGVHAAWEPPAVEEDDPWVAGMLQWA